MSKKASKSSSGKSRKSSNSSKNISSSSGKKGTSGYDFSARVRKCCVSWHECVQKWESLNNSGLELATKIVNTQLQKTSDETTAEAQKKTSLQILSSSSLDNVDNKDKLVQLFYSLKEIHEKMSSLTSNFEAISSLHHMKEGESKENEPIFETWPLKNYVTLSRKLAEMFAKEIHLKEKVVGMVVKEGAQRDDRSKLMSCLAMWLHQPYLEDEYRQELEIMLLETGLKTE